MPTSISVFNFLLFFFFQKMFLKKKLLSAFYPPLTPHNLRELHQDFEIQHVRVPTSLCMLLYFLSSNDLVTFINKPSLPSKLKM